MNNPYSLFRPAEDAVWVEHAACRNHPPDLFFPAKGGSGSSEQTRRAQAVCAVCPVQPVCARDALKRPDRDGVWAGENMALKGAPRVTRYERLTALSAGVA